jgi:hypothetical protein
MIVLDLSILNQKGTPMFNSDLTANRPAAGIVGRIFIAIDSPYGIFRDTGTAWDQVSAGGGAGISGSGAATQVAFWNGTSSITGSNNLFWDSTNNYLGINTNTPTTALDVHHSTPSGAIFNQTTATNNNTINFQTSGSGRWRIGNFYTAGADDFGVFDVVGSLQQFTIVNTTGQTFIGAKTTAAGRLVVNSATADAHLQIVGANAPSIRIDNAGSGGTQRFVFGLATATNNFIQGATAGQFCISTQSSGAMLFGMWQTINATEAMRITTANNLLVGLTTDAGYRLDVGGTARVIGDTRINGILSIGVAPLSWNNGVNVLQVNSGSIYASNLLTFVGSNALYTNSGDQYINTGFATVYGQLSGEHRWYNAPSGTAGNAISFTQAMTLTQGGNLLVGTTTENGSRLQVNGDVSITGVLRETITTNTQTASYSLVLADNGKLILMNVATANNLTIPLNSSINFPVGTKIDVQQIGAGQTTIVATGGVTINSAGGALKLRLQYSGATLVQTATDVWSLFGDITT